MIKGDKSEFLCKTGKMDKVDQAASSEPGFSTNMVNSSVKKKERLVAQILATKFHTDPATEPEADKEVRLNPIMKYLIINGYVDGRYKRVVKRKRSKRQKTGIRAEVVESVGENQPAWLDTLKEEIAKMK
jgi:hypothetical protein